MSGCIEIDLTGLDGTDLLRAAAVRAGSHGNVLNLFGLAPDGKPVRLGSLVVGAHSRVTAAWRENASRALNATAARVLLNAIADAIEERKEAKVW